MRRLKIPFFHLKDRLIVAYTTIFLLVMIILMTGIYFFVHQTIQKLVDQSLSTQINLIKTTLETTAEASIKNYFRSRAWSSLDVVSDCYDRYKLGELSEAEAKAQAIQYIQAQKIGTSGYITVLSEDGKTIYHPFESVGTDMSSYSYVQEGMAAEETFIKYSRKNPSESIEREKSLYCVQFSPWKWYLFTTGYDSELQSLVSIDDFEKNILAISFGETGYPVVIGLDGTLLIHPKYKGVNMINRQDSMGDVTRKAIAERNGKTYYYWKNPEETKYRKKVTVYSEVEGFDMVVAATAYESEFMKPLYQFQWIFITSLLLCLVAIIFLTQWISHSITRPIVLVKEWMGMAEAGDLNIRSTLETEDEIGEIGRYFNNLMDTIQLKQEELTASILELQETQQRLVEEERFSSMGRLMTKVAHHMNTPIGNAITTVSYVEKETEKIEEALAEKRLNQGELKAYILTVFDSAHIVNKSLTAASSLIDSFKSLLLRSSPVQHKALNLSEFFNEHYLVPWALVLPGSIKINLICDAQIIIDTYPELLMLIFNNLTENSMIHGFKEGQEGCIDIELKLKSKGVEIIFADNGRGISIKESKRIFEPFYGADNNFAATGLGLYAVYNAVVQIFQGDIKYQGDVDKGVKFLIYIPNLQ